MLRSKGAAATQRQSTPADDKWDGRTSRWEHAAEPAPLINAARVMDEQRCGRFIGAMVVSMNMSTYQPVSERPSKHLKLVIAVVSKSWDKHPTDSFRVPT